MVYRSLGKDIPQTEIWPRIAKANRFGTISSNTYLMVRDALQRGFHAFGIQVRRPLQTLRLATSSGARVILNHRLSRDSSAGHYSVVVGIDEATVTLHDPFFGPAQRLPFADLLEVWQPFSAKSEIVGNTLVAIANPEKVADRECEMCHAPFPAAVACPQCKTHVPLHPARLLGCLNNRCVARNWNYLCCPQCDFMWTFTVAQKAGASPSQYSKESRSAGTGSDSKELWNLRRVFSAIDGFCAKVAADPGIANRSEIKGHLEFMKSSKEKLLLAHAEELMNRKAAGEQLAALVERAKEKEEAYNKKLQELNRVAPPLDGNELGKALLKNLVGEKKS
jgi:hypothetical protein